MACLILNKTGHPLSNLNHRFMKTSIYNNFITYDNKNVCYNLLNDKFVILEDDLKRIIISNKQRKIILMN